MRPLNITDRNKIKYHDSKFGYHESLWYSRGMSNPPNLLRDPSPLAMQLRIKRLREAKGWSVNMMAQLCGVGQSTVSNWQGSRPGQPPGREGIFTIARVTGASPDWIYRGEGEIPTELLAKVIAIHTGEMKAPKAPRKKRSKLLKKFVK